jgi:hypothetical protein
MDEYAVKTMMWHAVVDALMEHIPGPRTAEEREAFDRTADRITNENWEKYWRGDI